jgi:hypothetical protein
VYEKSSLVEENIQKSLSQGISPIPHGGKILYILFITASRYLKGD